MLLIVCADRFKNPGDVVVLSIHWGGNWEYQVDKRHRKFAHAAIKSAGIDVIHGHSSHHARGTSESFMQVLFVRCHLSLITSAEGINVSYQFVFK